MKRMSGEKGVWRVQGFKGAEWANRKQDTAIDCQMFYPFPRGLVWFVAIGTFGRLIVVVYKFTTGRWIRRVDPTSPSPIWQMTSQGYQRVKGRKFHSIAGTPDIIAKFSYISNELSILTWLISSRIKEGILLTCGREGYKRVIKVRVI